jgi:AcrR family transcriptional regulator
MTDRPGRRTRLDPATRRDQILHAAVDLFARAPLASVSSDDIAAAAGVSRGLVNHYFGGTRGVYLEVVRSIAEIAPSVVRTDLALSAEERISYDADAWLDLMEARGELWLAVAGAGTSTFDVELERVLEEARETMVDRILLDRAGTTDVPPQARLVVRGLLGLVATAAREWLLLGRATRAEVHDLIVSATVTLTREVAPAALPAAEPREVAPGSVLEPGTTPPGTPRATSARPSSGP